MKAYTYYRLTAIAVILVNPEFSLLNVFLRNENTKALALSSI